MSYHDTAHLTSLVCSFPACMCLHKRILFLLDPKEIQKKYFLSVHEIAFGVCNRTLKFLKVEECRHSLWSWLGLVFAEVLLEVKMNLYEDKSNPAGNEETLASQRDFEAVDPRDRLFHPLLKAFLTAVPRSNVPKHVSHPGCTPISIRKYKLILLKFNFRNKIHTIGSRS